MTNAVVTIFTDETLNEIGGQLIENYKGYNANRQLAKEYLGKAIVRRFMSGKLLSDNHERIMDECGSQRAFGEEIGVTEAMLSNDKRAYEALKEEGVTEPKQMLDHLHSKNIKTNVYEWERLPKILAEPQEYREPDRRPTPEKQLEEAYDHVNNIRKNAESASNNHIAQLATDQMKEIGELQDHLKKLDPFSYEWRSRKYINWAKSLGWDFINDEPAENLEFHHTDMYGGSGGEGTKVPDVFGVPTSIKTHSEIERGAYKPTSDQLASALIKLHSLFIMKHWEG